MRKITVNPMLLGLKVVAGSMHLLYFDGGKRLIMKINIVGGFNTIIRN